MRTIQERIDQFLEVKRLAGDKIMPHEVAVIFDQVCRDDRTLYIEGAKKRNGMKNPDEPATEPQKKLMRDLKIPSEVYPDYDITKAEASRLIDEKLKEKKK